MQQTANDRLLRAFDNLDHSPFRATFAVLTNDAHLDAVAVQDRTHFIGRQVNVRLTIITDQKSMTITVALNTANNFFQHCTGLSYFFDIQSFDP